MMPPVSDAYADVTTAYEGVEDLDSFSPDALNAYRVGVLARSEQQAAFVHERLPPGARIVEIGSGNGRLLIALARDAAIAHGTGLEIAASRTAFARRWAEDEGVANALDLRVADALTAALPAGLDAAICITGAFAYFDAIQPGAGARLLQRLYAALKLGGTLILELYPHPGWRRMLDAADGDLRVWQELPEDDPWRFYLSRLTIHPTTSVLTHRKMFVHRTDGSIDDSRREHLRLYDEAAIRQDLEAAGFADVEAFGGWHAAPASPEDELLVVTSTRR